MVSLIDTDVMIDVSRANSGAASYLDALSEPAISIITAHELIVGARDKRDIEVIDSLISMYVVLPIDAAIGRLAYELLKHHGESGRFANVRFIDRRDRARSKLHARQ